MSETQSLRASGPPGQRRPSAKPSKRPVLAPSDYPDSDDELLAETPFHLQVLFGLLHGLYETHRGRDDAYVGCDMMMYVEEGNLKAYVAPDLFVALGVEPRPDEDRRTWRIWEEGGRGPDFVLEVTSKATRKVDEGRKKALYEEIGVREYWQFDPTADYLKPQLKGHRLGSDGKFRPVVLERRGELLLAPSLLGLEFHLQDGRLRFFDPRRNDYLATPKEEAEARQAAESAQQAAERAQQEAETAQREAEGARLAAEARVAELERRLRGQ